MPNPATFDLNHALLEWRARLSSSPAFQARDLFELEGHLRESIAQLRSPQLSEEDCFVLAVHRLGSAEKLTAEFGKVNRRELWLERVMWMLAGSLLVGFVTGLSGTAARVIMLLTQSVLPGVASLSVWFAVVSLGFLALGVFLAWRMLRRPPVFFRTGLRALLQNRPVAVLALLLMTSFSMLISLYSTRHIISTQGPEAMSRFMMAQTWSMWATHLAWSLFIIITFVCLAKRHLNNSSTRPSTF